MHTPHYTMHLVISAPHLAPSLYWDTHTSILEQHTIVIGNNQI